MTKPFSPARLAAPLLGLALTGCIGVPEGLAPVDGFEPARFLGRWHEVARLDHRFERGLQAVTADYALRPDGGIDVTNRGLDCASGQWREAEGRAYFVRGPEVGQLRVSFFGPFYSGYNVVLLDPEYGFALVAGNDRSYLWILSRTPALPEATLRDLVAAAARLGFPTGELLYPDPATGCAPGSRTPA